MTILALRTPPGLRSVVRPRIRASFCVALTLLGMASCTASDSRSAGTDLDALPEFALVEDRRIGSVDDPDYGFSGIGGLDEDGDGNVYVFEATDSEIRVYAPDGGLVRRIGREGEGPGEFRGYPQFGIEGDTLWAIETSSRRITLFRLDGTVLTAAPVQSVSVHTQRSIGIVMPAAMRPDGLFTSALRIYMSPRGVKLEVGPEDTVRVPRVLFDATGAVVDTAGWMPRPPEHYSPSEPLEMGGNRYYVPRAPPDDAMYVALPDGYLVVDRPYPESAESGTLVVTRFGSAGDTVYSRAWRYRPTSYDDVALDTLAWRAARIPGGGIPVINGVMVMPEIPDDSMAVFREIRSRMDFPALQMPVRVERLGRDGTVWLMREDDGGPARTYLILDPDAGRFVGRVVVPRSANPVWMTTRALWAIERDEMDVPWLVHFQLRS